MTVLLVDDDPSIREVLAELLEDEGYTVARATDGADALRLLRQQQEPPCLILLDLMMPTMNGWEFRDAQRRDPALAPIPVIAISAHADIELAAAQLDAAGCLAKPVDIERLLSTVEHFCAG